MKILFVGESWQGSSARSLREALARRNDVTVFELDVATFMPAATGLALRLANRVLAPLQRAELERAVLSAASRVQPDCILIYKGGQFGEEFIRRLSNYAGLVVNVFPDCSPHSHGDRLAKALGAYDLVISTKPFHPALWRSAYGYANPCVFVPHGYDPLLHLREDRPGPADIDVALVASGRAEYHVLIRDLAARLSGDDLRVVIAGPGWAGRAGPLPEGWTTPGPRHGMDYIALIRRARIVIAPVQRRVVVKGLTAPGDEDSTRTYELAAAGCFFIHRRTDFMPSVFDPCTEVPLYDDADDLARQIRHYLAHGEERRAMAEAAHARAVPAYALDRRAAEIVAHLEAGLRNLSP